MTRAFVKDILREIKSSFSRFISIFAIVALGCGFFAGVKATSPDMQKTAHNYFIRQNLMDISLVSSYGVTKEDAFVINQLDCVSGVMPAYSKDVIYNFDDNSVVFRLFSYNSSVDDSSAYKMNIPKIREGRLPLNSGEIALEINDMTAAGFEIGQTIKLNAPDGETLTDSLNTDEFTIVGVIDLPLYIGYTRDTTTVGNGKVNTNCVIIESDFTMEYYTEMYVTVKGAKELDPFSQEYNDYINNAKLEIESVFSAQVQSRYEDILFKANSQYNNAKESIEFMQSLMSAESLDEITAIRDEKNNEYIELKAMYDKAVEEESSLRTIYRSKVLQAEKVLTQLEEFITAYSSGNTELLSGYEQQLEEAQLQLSAAEEQINVLAEPVYFNTTRNNHTDYSSYKADSERVDAIAKVFPVFFILVAALVCLTTMTRMVEEQRIQIGTYKALGYSSSAIIAKYLIYALSAAVSGGLVGMAIGFKAFPIIIFECYKLLYNIEKVEAPFKWDYAFACIGVTIICVGITVIAACINELKSVPATLMRPKAPKAGKRVILENIPVLWNKIGFLTKVTIRNLFRYKKRFFMTIIGVAGCTALIITGFGLKNSIASMVDVQFSEIFIYDGMIIPKESTDNGLVLANNAMEKYDEITGSLNILQSTADTYYGENTVNAVYLIVPESYDNFSDFVVLKDDNKRLSFSDDGIIVTRKMSILLDCKVGDSIEIKLPDGYPVTAKVTGIADCYAMHYVVMTPAFYEKLFGEKPQMNNVIVNIDENADKDKLSEKLLLEEDILAVSMIGDTAKSFTDMLESLNLIVIVLIVCAAALAFVVLYNLGNINITERVREIATIKVLGFYDGEVSSYIYRESFFSAFIGIFIGWILGAVLHRFVVITAEVDLVMFERSLRLSDLIISSLFTVAFTALVNVALHFKLKKISMVESLKTVE